LAGIASIAGEVAAHRGAENEEERGIEAIAPKKLFPPTDGQEKFIDNQVFGELVQTIPGTPSLQPPDLEEDTLEKISSFRVIGNMLESFAYQGQGKEPFLADVGEYSENRFGCLGRGEMLNSLVGIHPRGLLPQS
jgi:hypothetical protein